MSLLYQIWSDLPTVGRIVLLIVVAAVLIGAMYFGVLPAVLEWLNHA